MYFFLKVTRMWIVSQKNEEKLYIIKKLLNFGTNLNEFEILNDENDRQTFL